mgnify:FL=1
MKKLLLLTIILLGLSMESQAQKRSGVGLHIGYLNVGTFTPITPENEFTGHIEDNNANGLHVGFRYNLKFGPLGFSPELNFMHLKWDVFLDDTELSTDFYVKESRNYIAMPLLLKWYIGPINIYTGPQFSYLIGGKIETSALEKRNILEHYDIPFTDVTGTETEQIQMLRRTDIAGVLGLGVDTKIGVYASIRTSISFTPIYGEEYIDFINEYNYKKNELPRYIYTQIFVGYRF